MQSSAHDDGERLRRAYSALERMQAKLEASETARTEPMAVVGIGCRFPGAGRGPDAFWRLLKDGVDAITEVPPQRWDVASYFDPNPGTPGRMCSRHGGFVSDVDAFDPRFFGIAPREAEDMDPQQFMVLETAWEALEHAAIVPDRLFQSRTGVFLGAGTVDFALRRLADATGRAAVTPHFGTGSALSVAAGRLSYVLGLNGPCLSLDTACSSSLVSVHLACNSLRAGECDLALAGGVSVLLHPTPSVNFSQARMLAPDGRCRTFDAAASGYVRGEGCGIVVLKRLADARRDRDPIVAVLLGSAVNHDGPSGGLTVPNGPAQQAVIREALTHARVKPEEVGYVECHGTGTPLGDPIELEALGATFGEARPAALRVGSVKTNVGHLEVAAGIAGLIKAILSVTHGEIAPHLHFRDPNPRVSWKDLPIEVAARGEPWPMAGRRIAGVSAFGFSGTNAHVVVAAERIEDRKGYAGGPHRLLLSARSDAALRAMAAHYADWLAVNPDLALDDVATTLWDGRTRFDHWLVMTASTHTEAVANLRHWSRGEPVAEVTSGRAPDAPPPVESAGCRVALPTYPFEEMRFPLGPAPEAAGDTVFHPLLGRPMVLAESREHRFEARLSLAGLTFLEDHRIFGRVLLPIAAFLEMAAAAGMSAYGTEAIDLHEVVLRQPLLLERGSDRIVQTVLTAAEGDALSVEIYSRAAEAGDGAMAWTKHLAAKIGVAGGAPDAVHPGEDAKPIDPVAIYDDARTAGMDYGPSFRSLATVRAGTRAAMATLRLPVMLAADRRYAIHPVLLDGGIQLLGVAVRASSGGAAETRLPVGVDRIQIRRSTTAQLEAVCRTSSTRAGIAADVAMRNESGTVVALLQGISLLPVDRELLARAVAGREESASRPAAPSRRDAPPGRPGTASGEDIVAYLRAVAGEVLRLGVEQVDAAVPLTDLGLDSLMAVDLRERVRADLGLDLPLQSLIVGGSIADLAAALSADVHTGATMVEGEL